MNSLVNVKASGLHADIKDLLRQKGYSVHKTICSLILALTGVAYSSHAATLIESLTKCDASFFSTIHDRQNEIKPVAPVIAGHQHHAWFKVPSADSGTLWFTQPLHDSNLTILGYYLQTSDLEALNMGKYYYWGFILKESPEIVMSQLNHLSWSRADDEYYSQALIKDPGEHDWKKNPAAVGSIAPAKGSTEKLLMLSKSGNQTKLLCSIQGDVPPELLYTVRPDLAEEKRP